MLVQVRPEAPNNNMTIFIASDHRGFDLKKNIINTFQEFIDIGPFSSESPVDYPIYANLVSENVLNKENSKGILVCSTGVGVCIAANRHRFIRAAVCNSLESLELALKHNNINVLCLAAKYIESQEIDFLIKYFVNFHEEIEDRHVHRINMIDII